MGFLQGHNKMSDGFGLATLKPEGCPVHPHDMACRNKKHRIKQLIGHFDWLIKHGNTNLDNYPMYNEYLKYVDLVHKEKGS